MANDALDDLAFRILREAKVIPLSRASGIRPLNYLELERDLHLAVAFEHAWSNSLHTAWLHRDPAYLVL